MKSLIITLSFWVVVLSSCKKNDVSESITPFQPKTTEYNFYSLTWSPEEGLRFIKLIRPVVDGELTDYSVPVDTFSNNHFVQVLIKLHNSTEWRKLNYSFIDSTGHNGYDLYYTVLSTRTYVVRNRIVIFAKESASIDFSNPVTVKVIKIG